MWFLERFSAIPVSFSSTAFLSIYPLPISFIYDFTVTQRPPLRSYYNTHTTQNKGHTVYISPIEIGLPVILDSSHENSPPLQYKFLAWLHILSSYSYTLLLYMLRENF